MQDDGDIEGKCSWVGNDTPEWLATIRKVKPGIVALRVTGVRAFEDCSAGTWCGTGFVVDASAGLILTNRHVISIGPIRAVAHFDQNEELPCEVLYRDPCHDFGLLRFDPSALEFTPAVAIPLAPDELRIGTEIRVIGNDNAEKVQILQGTVARVDRNAPEYSGYFDDNTFYVGAASSTSGGSSGSPVLNVCGHAVALNAGGALEAASAYYLPLDRVAYAVGMLRQGKLPPRGTVGCRLTFRTYAEAERLGLTASQKAVAVASHAKWAAEVPGRQAKRGVLVCDQVLSGGAAALAGVEPGDALLSLGGISCVDFVDLEKLIDAAAPEPWSEKDGEILTFVWARRGEERSTELSVADLHPLVARGFVECGAAIFHAVSYQRAMKWHVPLAGKGAHLCLAGIFGDVGCGALITEVAFGSSVWPVSDLTELFVALKEVPDASYVRIHFRDWNGHGHGRERSAEVRIDKRLWPLRLWRFEPTLPNRWTLVDDVPVEPPAQITRMLSASKEPRPAPTMDTIQSSLVEVSFFVHSRLLLEGMKPRGVSATLYKRLGAGVVIDVERRLLLTGRSIVPQLLGTVEVTFSKSLTIDARPLLIHPELNVVVLQLCQPFPPGVVAAPPTDSGELFDTPRRGMFVGLDHRGYPVQRECTVTLDELWNPPILVPPRPRQGVNCELLQALNDEEVSDGLGGIFCFPRSGDEPLSTAAVFLEFIYDNLPECHFIRGLTASALQNVVEQAIGGAPFVFPSLELELGELSFAGAKRGALSDGVLAAISKGRPLRRTVVTVERLHAGGAAATSGLRPGDVLLSAGGHPLAGPGDLARVLASRFSKEVSVEIWREGRMQLLEAHVAALEPEGVTRVVCWHGLLCVRTPRAYVEAWGRRPALLPGVTVISVLLGSPGGEEEKFRSNTWIACADGHPVGDLDDLRTVDQALTGDSRHVIVTLVDGNGLTCVRTLRPDPLFWPSMEWWYTGDGWVRAPWD